MDFGGFQPLPDHLLEVMTPAERADYDNALTRHVTLQSPLDMALLTTPETAEHPHVRLLNTLIVALVEHRLYKEGPCGHPGVVFEGLLAHPEGQVCINESQPCLSKLFITMPPRHGKSFLVSEHAPAWFLARYPNRRVIFASYEADFAAKFGAKARDIVQQHGTRFGIAIDKATGAKDNWDLAGTRGGMTTAGAGGPITGKGGDFLLCDDPIKNQEEARSESARRNLYDWWHATFKTRRQPGGNAVICLIHTRWHEADLGGTLMEEEGEEWFHIDLPALQYSDPDQLSDTRLHSGAGNPLAREPGAALCPEFFSQAWLLRERKGNPSWFDSLYQGRPTTEGSGIFKREHFRYWKMGGDPHNPRYDLQLPGGGVKFVPRDSCYHFQTVDLAATEKRWSDYTVFSTWACTPDKDLILVDRYRKRIDSADHVPEFETNLADLRRQGIKVRVAGVEAATYGLTLIRHLIRLRLLPIMRFEADKDKVSRAQPAGLAMVNGVFYWPADAPWLREWEDEHLQFPHGRHDDQVDTTSYAAHMLYESGIGWRPPVKESEAGTLQERVDAKIDKMMRHRKGKGMHHPDLGRIG